MRACQNLLEKSDTPMTEPTHVFPLRQPHALDDPLTDLLRAGARQLLAQAIEIEAEAYLASMRE